MTGGPERYADRGLIPRTLSYIFSECKKRTDTHYKVGVSYLEIYNNNGYDLLDENHTTKQLSDLPKVKPRELASLANTTLERGAPKSTLANRKLRRTVVSIKTCSLQVLLAGHGRQRQPQLR